MQKIGLKKIMIMALSVGIISSTIVVVSLQPVVAPLTSCAKVLVRYDTLQVAEAKTGEMEITGNFILVYNDKNGVAQTRDYHIPAIQFKFNSVDELDSSYIKTLLTQQVLKLIKSEPIPKSCKSIDVLIPSFEIISLSI